VNQDSCDVVWSPHRARLDDRLDRGGVRPSLGSRVCGVTGSGTTVGRTGSDSFSNGWLPCRRVRLAVEPRHFCLATSKLKWLTSNGGQLAVGFGPLSSVLTLASEPENGRHGDEIVLGLVGWRSTISRGIVSSLSCRDTTSLMSSSVMGGWLRRLPDSLVLSGCSCWWLLLDW